MSFYIYKLLLQLLEQNEISSLFEHDSPPQLNGQNKMIIKTLKDILRLWVIDFAGTFGGISLQQ